jgi:hypothetical protein
MATGVVQDVIQIVAVRQSGVDALGGLFLHGLLMVGHLSSQ